MPTTSTRYITRFAPSPTGLLHKGHAYSALLAYKMAQENNGRFLLRIEDIDTTRCKPEFISQIYTDLAWLDIKWEQPVRKQSEHFAEYQTTLDTLKDKQLIYPCFCTRKEIQAEIARAPSAPHGPDGALYPGTCKGMPKHDIQKRLKAGHTHAWRLDLSAALQQINTPLSWHDALKGTVTARPQDLGDVVLARKDTPTSYHLAVVLDDDAAGITHIIRGEDLFHATHIHVVLQQILGLPTPQYHHHPLLLDDTGERFAKRNKSATLSSLQGSGVTAASIKASFNL